MVDQSSLLLKSFWSGALGVGSREIVGGATSFSSTGIYRERREDAVYLFEHLGSKSVVVNCPFDQISEIKKIASRSLVDLEDFLEKKFDLSFDDFDLNLLGEVNSFTVDDPYSVIQMRGSYRSQLESFLKSCTEDEVDTLDIDDSIPDANIVVVRHSQSIVGAGRYSIIPGTEVLADLTLLTSPNHRAKGLAKAILTTLVHELLRLKLVPRYRVKTDNASSIKVAERLGFKKFNRIRTYDPKRAD